MLSPIHRSQVRSTTQRAEPQHTCTVLGSPCFPGLWWAFIPPGRRALRASSPTPWGRGLPPAELILARGLTRFCARMVTALRASRDRVNVAGETTAWHARRLRGFPGTGGAHPAQTMAEQTCPLRVRGDPAPCTCSGDRLFV